jgi:hypothetical protein
LVSIIIGVDLEEDLSKLGISDTTVACGVDSPGINANADTTKIPKITIGKITFRFNCSKLAVKIIKKLFQFETNV